jgi:hypothetical protein
MNTIWTTTSKAFIKLRLVSEACAPHSPCTLGQLKLLVTLTESVTVTRR